MQQISRVLPSLRRDQTTSASVSMLQARLLGVSGLLPSDDGATEPAANAYLRRIWDLWWREREQFHELILPRTLWRLGGIRPANNPQRRLALAAHWLVENNLPNRLEQWFSQTEPGAKLTSSLWQVLQTSEDSFWSRHWTFRSEAMPESQPLIGPQRVTDLAVNVVLPWFWIRAEAGQNQALQRRAEALYFAWPKAQDNAVLRLARRRLFNTSQRVGLTSAALQQGLLQIVRDFCDFSNSVCDHCQFPAMVQQQQQHVAG